MIVLAVAGGTATPGQACTSFFMDGGPRIMAANLDWPTGDGLVVINKRGFSKTALSDAVRQPNPAVWVSRYGSVTFNPYGIDWPWAGMNEAGLAGAALLMRWTTYPAPDARPSIFLLQWLQYQLDCFGTVREVLDHLPAIRIRPASRERSVHFLLCDRTGDAAVIDFIDGAPLVYQGAGLPIRAMANDPYASSLVYAKRFSGFGGSLPLSDSNLSKDRFLRAAAGIAGLSSLDAPAAVEAAFGLLDRVAYRSSGAIQTQWRVVFDLMDERLYYLTRDNPRRRYIDLPEIDFSCRETILQRDVQLDTASGSAGFKAYTQEEGRQWLARFFDRHPLRPTETAAKLDRISRYPNTFICKQPHAN